MELMGGRQRKLAHGVNGEVFWERPRGLGMVDPSPWWMEGCLAIPREENCHPELKDTGSSLWSHQVLLLVPVGSELRSLDIPLIHLHY